MVAICTNGKIMVSTSLSPFDEIAAKTWSRKRQNYGQSHKIDRPISFTDGEDEIRTLKIDIKLIIEQWDEIVRLIFCRPLTVVKPEEVKF